MHYSINDLIKMITETFMFEDGHYTIIIGSNRYENFKIIDNASGTDIWFHIDGEPSCHIILKTVFSLRGIPKQVIKRCACLCKMNSKAKTQKKCKVIYTQIQNITKTEVIGQVIVGVHKSVRV